MAFVDFLVDDGFVILGGPVGYDYGALLLVESADEQHVRARLEDRCQPPNPSERTS